MASIIKAVNMSPYSSHFHALSARALVHEMRNDGRSFAAHTCYVWYVASKGHDTTLDVDSLTLFLTIHLLTMNNSAIACFGQKRSVIFTPTIW